MRKVFYFTAILFCSIFFMSCCDTVQSLATEGNQMWKLERANDIEVPSENEDTFNSFAIFFSENDSTIAGVGACNRFFGKYEVGKNGSIEINIMGTTKMFCPNMESEDNFISTLNSSNNYKIDNDKLILLNEEEEVAVFIKKTSTETVEE